MVAVMQPVDYLAALRHDADRLVTAAEGHLDRVVPSCPGWCVSDLVWHVGIVQMFWRMIASGALTGPDGWHEPDRPAGDDLLPWFRHGIDLTVASLTDLAPDTPAWTWGRRQDVGFIRRRVAQETAVHCWDGQNAVGCTEPIARVLAVDGVDEFFDEVLPGLGRDRDGPAQTIRLRAGDADRAWTVRAGGGVVQLIDPAEPPDATVTGTAANLLLLVWGRCAADSAHLRVDGDLAALRRFLARAEF
ncbi:MAG: maleylpyruvate isomerase family mycothiol-dependent enzyme [Mycobacteriaceae bacterium]|nr:maleylpyruvate isomerase family mycothiol-dependent enzyme [Mycobacteriaceae bacterium]